MQVVLDLPKKVVRQMENRITRRICLSMRHRQETQQRYLWRHWLKDTCTEHNLNAASELNERKTEKKKEETIH